MAKWIREYIGPRSSGPHRAACKALYRALLDLYPRVPLPTDLPSQGAVNPIKHLIRRGFRRHQYSASAPRAVQALKVGYNAIDLLRAAAAGSPAATSQIHRLLYRLHTQRQQSKQPPAPPRPTPPRIYPYPGAPKLLESRPLPREKIVGNRRVPTLTHATGVPFLRFRRPQSLFLSRVLRNKLKQRQTLFGALKNIEDFHIRLATWEDEWDLQVSQQLRREGGAREARGIENEVGDFLGWKNEVADARTAVRNRIADWWMTMKQNAIQMAEVVEKEKKLRDEEMLIKKNEKREKRARLLEERRKEQEAGKEIDPPAV